MKELPPDIREKIDAELVGLKIMGYSDWTLEYWRTALERPWTLLGYVGDRSRRNRFAVTLERLKKTKEKQLEKLTS